MKFRLDGILRLRKFEADEAKLRLSERRQELKIILDRIQSYYDAMDASRQNIAEIQKQGGSDAIGKIKEAEQFIEGQKLLIIQTRLQAREAMALVETAEGELMNRVQSQRVLEKLKGRHLEREKIRQDKIADKQADENAVMRQRGRKNVHGL